MLKRHQIYALWVLHSVLQTIHTCPLLSKGRGEAEEARPSTREVTLMRRIVMLLSVATMLVMMLATGGVASAHVSVGGMSIDTGGSYHVHLGCKSIPGVDCI